MGFWHVSFRRNDACLWVGKWVLGVGAAGRRRIRGGVLGRFGRGFGRGYWAGGQVGGVR